MFNSIKSFFSGSGGGAGGSKALIHNERSYREGMGAWQAICNTGGPYFTISIYAGIYLDFGYVEITKKVDGTDKTEISHDMLFMGAGGFLGAMGTLGFALQLAIGYVVVEGNADVRIFLGSEANPNKTLDMIRNSNGETMKGQDFGFNFEFAGTLSAGLSLGIGIYRVVGARGTGGLAFQFGYGKNMAKWFPDVGTNWGYNLDWTLSGSLDLIVTSVELFQFSWPTGIEGGWMSYFMRARQAELLVTFINLGINKGKGSEEARRYCREKADELAELVDSGQGNKDTLLALIKPLKDYAYKNGIISWTQWSRVNMNKQAGIIGSILNAKDTDNWSVINSLDEDDEAEIYSEGEMDEYLADSMGEIRTLHVTDHVDSEWVAGSEAELQAAYSPVHTETLMKNAIENPASEIMALGNNRFLVVFLGDDASRGRQMKAALMWSVYDASSDSWTKPQILQNDGTADGKPHLCDAGDKVVLSWTSIDADKYSKLKEDIAADLKAANGTKPDDDEIQSELEANPSRVLMSMDVFSVEFDKQAEKFGDIEQLTDDNYYDNYPQAVYDEATGDYIVLYTKTAQASGRYTSEEDKVNDLLRQSPDPEKTYSYLCYMLYNNRTDIEDTKGEAHEKGWARDYYFPNETAETSLEEQAKDLAKWKGQRFLRSTVKTDSGYTITDPAIADLTTANGFNGCAAMAYTVDMDLNASTNEDKELYVKYYRFDDHRTYVAVKTAGDVTSGGAASQVSVAQPKLIRNGGSTWLFWHEGGNTLKYLNISDMLNKKVLVSQDADPENSDNWIYALQPDGTFAVDPETGTAYEPESKTVDFTSEFNDGSVKFSEYRVMSDKDDNLYVIWTDSVGYEREDEGVVSQAYAQEIYASAMVKEDKANTFTDGDGNTDSTEGTSAKWSRPYRLTKGDKKNDGVAVALDENGGLVIIHNEYEELLCDSFDKLKELVDEGKLGIAETESGQHYIMGSMTYNSPVSLKLTRFDEVGSLEATGFEFSHNYPVAGEDVGVAAFIENTGTTSAYGIDAKFYEYKNGRQGKELFSYQNDEIFPVNSSAEIDFIWTVPDEGTEDYQIQAVVREKDKNGNYYDALVSYSDPFTLEPRYSIKIDKCEQNGDVFDVAYSATNSGNADFAEGTKAELSLVGLYGDVREKYGVDNPVLVSEDVSGLKPRETKTIEKSISVPVSVFRYCGYDAVSAAVVSDDGDTLNKSDQVYITMEKPINAVLCGGTDMEIKAGETKSSDLNYDSTVFTDVSGKTLYTIADPDIASVDAEGNVTGLSEGTTTLTATLMPSGVSESAAVKVTGQKRSSGGSGGGGTTVMPTNPADPNNPNNPDNPSGTEVSFVDVPENTWFTDSVKWAVENGVTNGTAEATFSPNDSCTRAQMVTFLWRAAGSPEPASADNPFTDVDIGLYYGKAVLWAVENGITTGIDAAHFAPDQTVDRGQTVTFIYRTAGSPAAEGDVSRFIDLDPSFYYMDAVRWAVANNVTQGMGEDIFCPDDDCSRAQIVTLLYRYYAA